MFSPHLSDTLSVAKLLSWAEFLHWVRLRLTYQGRFDLQPIWAESPIVAKLVHDTVFLLVLGCLRPENT